MPGPFWGVLGGQMSLPLGLGTDETVGHMELPHVLSGSLDCSDQLTQATACPPGPPSFLLLSFSVWAQL